MDFFLNYFFLNFVHKMDWEESYGKRIRLIKYNGKRVCKDLE